MILRQLGKNGMMDGISGTERTGSGMDGMMKTMGRMIHVFLATKVKQPDGAVTLGVLVQDGRMTTQPVK